jgi:hypothetical protein
VHDYLPAGFPGLRHYVQERCMSVASSSSLTADLPRVHWRKRLPPLSTCLLGSFFISLVVIAQVFAEELEPNLPLFDGAVVNIVSLIFRSPLF